MVENKEKAMFKKLWMGLGLVVVLSMVACGTPDPTCAKGEVVVKESGKAICKKSCTADTDCATGEICHKDEAPAHCDKKD